MVDDPNRKTPRQFQCRDYLWDAFEQMSSELECSIDYLINEAMRHYLRAQGRTGVTKGPAANTGEASRPATQPVPTPAGAMRMPGPTAAPSARQPAIPAIPQRTSIPAAPARPAMPGAQGGGGIPPLPAARPPSIPGIPQRTAPPGALPNALPKMGAPPPTMAQPRPAAPPGPPPVAAPGGRTLFAIYADQEVPVTKEEFFIGRGQKLCDLVIRDTNISRQHARVVLHNGQYWILDNQSTNGVEFRGAKIQQKRVDDGDVFTICGHEVQFVYR
jgi:hypothetical protein